MSNHQPSTEQTLQGMKKQQRDAIQLVIDSTELLQTAWDNPRRYNLGKRTEALVVLMVAISNGVFIWEASVRIKSRLMPVLRRPKMWTELERERATKILFNELLGVGQQLGQEIWSSTNALHLTKKLTEEEIAVARAAGDYIAEEDTDAASGPEEGREAAQAAGDQGDQAEAG